MKLLWKLNACVLLFCLGVSVCADLTNQVQAQTQATNQLEVQTNTQTESVASLERHHKKIDMYEENEKMLDKMESSKLPTLKKSSNSYLYKSEEEPAPASEEFGTFFTEKSQKPTKSLTKSKGITYIHLNNPKLDRSKWSGYSKCQSRKGFLEILKNENYTGNRVELETARVQLTPEKLVMYTTMDENSLFTTIELRRILKISQETRYKGSGCFDIILNEAFASQRFLKKRRVTVCAEDKVSMGKWVHSIFEMKECNYDIVHKNSKIVLDFNEINKIKKDDKDMKDMYYDNTKKVGGNNKIQSAKFNIIKNTVNNLMKTIQIRNFEQAKVVRSLDTKLKEAQAFTREMDKKQDLIQRIIKKKKEQQRNIEIKNVKKKAVGKVTQLIKAMAMKIKDMKTKEVKSIRKMKKKEIKAERAQAQKAATKMMTSIIKEKRNIPYNRCTDPKVSLLADKVYLENVCYEMFGLSRKEKCKQPENFCPMCCRHHVGVRMAIQYENCFLICKSLQTKGSKHNPDLVLA